MSVYLGMDIGGTSLKLGAWDGERRLAWQEDIALPDGGADLTVKEHLLDVVREFCAGQGLAPDGLGVGSCGLISGGKIFQSPNTPWNTLPLVPLLEPELNYPVYLLNDADAFLVQALTELPDSQAVVLGITLGTGIGTALWVRDSLYRGGAGISPEGGHITLNLYGETGTSGVRGTWETLACRDALMRYFREAGGSGAGNPREVAELAERGNHSAVTAWNRFGMLVGTGLASLCNFLSPDYVLVGGGLTGARDLFHPALIAALNRQMLQAMPRPDIKYFDEQPDSVARGAMRYAAQRGRDAI